jgi:hypothetical protein
MSFSKCFFDDNVSSIHVLIKKIVRVAGKAYPILLFPTVLQH